MRADFMVKERSHARCSAYWTCLPPDMKYVIMRDKFETNFYFSFFFFALLLYNTKKKKEYFSLKKIRFFFLKSKFKGYFGVDYPI